MSELSVVSCENVNKTGACFAIVECVRSVKNLVDSVLRFWREFGSQLALYL